MSERTSELFEQGVEQYDSATEAWEALKESREEVDWNPGNMPDIVELMDDE